jgi:beta-xylosidase
MIGRDKTAPLPALLCLLAFCGNRAAAQTTPATESHGPAPAASFPEGVPPPVITDKFTADPHAVVIGDTYYIYPTVDKENWATTEFNVWSSKDLIHWKDEGVILDLAGQATGRQDVAWAKLRAWAPGAIARDGKVFFYFSGDTNIGVAVADSPTGPFREPIGKPLVAKGAYRGQMIDPAPFLDDVPAPDAPAGAVVPSAEPQAYLYFGNGNLYVAKLNRDMIRLDGPVTRMPVSGNGAAFREGIIVFKRKGTYYFMWSEDDARSPDYRVAYGTATSPLGPVEVAQNRVILSKAGRVIGTGHHSVINVPSTDDWYIVYHRHAVPGGNGYIRETCLSKMEFAPNSSGGPDIIKPVNVARPAFPAGSAGQPVPKS